MTLMLLTSDAAPVKFTADQCRVLRQTGVDIEDICPDLVKKKKRQ
jgi:hypothetical protein